MSMQTNDILYDEAMYIRELQTYLRALQRYKNGYADVAVDGIFGPNTTQAVRDFQQPILPVTGVVDLATWQAIYQAYLDLLYFQSLPSSVQVYQQPSIALFPGDQGDGVLFLQIMLRRLSRRFPNIPAEQAVTGIYTKKTASAVEAVQNISGLPQTGVTDKATWNAITALYNQD
ncbi:MAG: peptidoglycan-binding protein [Loktanella sp.]|nr:peptidoglycan-binding protein [Loktanella sp.]